MALREPVRRGEIATVWTAGGASPAPTKGVESKTVGGTKIVGGARQSAAEDRWLAVERGGAEGWEIVGHIGRGRD